MRAAALVLAIAPACAPPAGEGGLSVTDLDALADLDPQHDPADLTPLARRVYAHLARRGGRPLAIGDLEALGGPPPPADFVVPETVRMWRRSEGSSSSCTGTVQVVEFDEYLRHVIPHEWYASWHEESLRSGAIAARSYAAWWVAAGGKYDCADVCDTSSTQNYGESTDARTDAAVAYTSGAVAVNSSGVVFAEYSAENADPTEYGVSEPLCTGEARYGHGRGLCQWGSQRWSSQEGYDHRWIIEHYYPGAWVQAPLVAHRLDAEDTLELESGERVVLEISWKNAGIGDWTAGDVHLELIDPAGRTSELEDATTWPGPSRAATLLDTVEPGGDATISLALQAPQVQENTSWDESFGLFSEGREAWFPDDGALTLHITVLPPGGGVDDTGGATLDTAVYEGPLGSVPPSIYPPAADTGGCGCGTGAPPGGALAVASLALLAMIGRRRRRPNASQTPSP